MRSTRDTNICRSRRHAPSKYDQRRCMSIPMYYTLFSRAHPGTRARGSALNERLTFFELVLPSSTSSVFLFLSFLSTFPYRYFCRSRRVIDHTYTRVLILYRAASTFMQFREACDIRPARLYSNNTRSRGIPTIFS